MIDATRHPGGASWSLRPSSGMTLRVGPRALVSAVLLVLALALVPVAQAALTLSRAELNGTQLRVEGSGAVPNATVTIDRKSVV